MYARYEVRIIGCTQFNGIDTYARHDRIDTQFEGCIGRRSTEEHIYRFGQLGRVPMQTAYDQRKTGRGIGSELDVNRVRTHLHVRIDHLFRTGTDDRQDDVFDGVTGGDSNRHLTFIQLQESVVHQMCQHIVRMIGCFQSHSLRILYTLHLVAADGGQVRRELVRIRCLTSLRAITQDIFHHFDDIIVIIAVPFLTGCTNRIAVEQPVVDTRSLHFDRRYAIEVHRTLHFHAQVIGRVGA